MADFDVVVITAPDRLARRYIHQVLLIEELQQRGCTVVFVERPMSTDPNDQLLLQIRGAVAEYERTLITERMRRGKVAKLRSGQLLLRGYESRVDRFYLIRMDCQLSSESIPARVCQLASQPLAISEIDTHPIDGLH